MRRIVAAKVDVATGAEAYLAAGVQESLLGCTCVHVGVRSCRGSTACLLLTSSPHHCHDLVELILAEDVREDVEVLRATPIILIQKVELIVILLDDRSMRYQAIATFVTFVTVYVAIVSHKKS